ncbi:hypothetical protein [Deinococcus knuensis]|uniref:Uncharacterized protein n=1 Tax=Deinococcus knuensis TaxID=1837380 RepID=A0ABQ2SXJ3_9DEIO|nr:hypothetical protein [Deinococcus knuensis]GGS43727.1 hypothetical protein GCM10008961_38400 [Deinococcus knuensis]
MTTRSVLTGRRIRNLARHLGFFELGESVSLGLLVTAERFTAVERIGLTPAEHGLTLLPVIRGPVSRFNAEGRYLIRRDESKETAYRTVRWKWIERHGDERIEREEWKDVPYLRYPRIFVSPPSVELSLVQDDAGAFTVTAPSLPYDPQSTELLHQVNLFLELFGEVHVLGAGRMHLNAGDERRVNWQLLPHGEVPWDVLRAHLTPVFEQARSQQKRAFLNERLEALAAYGPEFTVVGAGGFTGYVLFAFPQRNLFVLESALYGNATYILRGAWEHLATLTKADLLRGDLHEARVPHQATWGEQLKAYLS